MLIHFILNYDFPFQSGFLVFAIFTLPGMLENDFFDIFTNTNKEIYISSKSAM